MASRKSKYLLAVFCSAALCLTHELLGQAKFDIMGRIESIGKINSIVLLFKDRPSETTYFMVENDTVFGSVEISSVTYNRSGVYRYRSIARYTLSNRQFARQIRAGVEIALVAARSRPEGEYTDEPGVVEKNYRRSIVSSRDGRRMVLVPEGRFTFGSNQGDRDESPEQAIYLDNYYIDAHEVSNDDYLAFVENSNVKPPLSWDGARYRDGEGSLPVMVTYYEAEAYAKWAGKRLPTEEEWEKAARGPGKSARGEEGKNQIYPWGNNFDSEKANTADFWADEKTGAHLKLRHGVLNRGPMPVGAFDPEGASPHGVLNMAGNAREWTSSWYLPYEGNRSRQGKEYRRYGKQFKVVRGGSWYSPRYRVRVTSRETGGSPSLRSDNLAGFRCVKEADVIDLERE